MKTLILAVTFSALFAVTRSTNLFDDYNEVRLSKIESSSTIQNNNLSLQKNESANSRSKLLVIKSSNLSEQLEKKKLENPIISPKKLADFANELIPKYGVNFWVDVADLIEKKAKAKKLEELDDQNVRFDFQLNLSDATEQTFQIDSPTDSCCCGYSYADFPVSNINDKQMTIIVDGKPYKVKRSKDISFSQEYILVDNKTKSKKIRSWQVPLETSPFGISEDGTKLYIEDESGLLLEITEAGNIRFVPKSYPSIIANGKDLRSFPAPKIGDIIYKSGEEGLMLFKSGNKHYIIDFPYVCT